MDFTINTDRKIEVNRKNFEENTCIMIDVKVPADKNISLKKFQKLSKCKYLEIDATNMWKLVTKTTPVVIGALSMIKKVT